MMARVCGVMSGVMRVVSIVGRSMHGSQSIGVSLARVTANAVAMNVLAGSITSSNFLSFFILFKVFKVIKFLKILLRKSPLHSCVEGKGELRIHSFKACYHFFHV